MKKNCCGCRALNLNFCGLGYKVERKWHKTFLYLETVPAEKCPKPKTYKELFILLGRQVTKGQLE